MMIASARPLVLLRSALLWSTTTAVAAGLATISAPALAASPDLLTASAFTDLLVAACAAATVVAAGWLWVITTDVVIHVVAAGGRVTVQRPGPARLVLLAACGAVVLSATAAPASADDHQPVLPRSLAGLPLPDRATSDGPVTHRADGPPRSLIRVAPGDSLWAIAEDLLGPRATATDVAGYGQRIYDRNVAVIGPDPDLIFPGQALDLPPIN